MSQFQHLLCIGGGSHGVKVEVPDELNYVNVADPRQHRVRRRFDTTVPTGEMEWTHSSYRRGWVKHTRVGRTYPVLIEQSLRDEEVDKLMTDLYINKGIRP